MGNLFWSTPKILYQPYHPLKRSGRANRSVNPPACTAHPFNEILPQKPGKLFMGFLQTFNGANISLLSTPKSRNSPPFSIDPSRVQTKDEHQHEEGPHHKTKLTPGSSRAVHTALPHSRREPRTSAGSILITC